MSAASTESTMSIGVTGKWCDIDGVWIDPVMAQMSDDLAVERR